MYSSDDSVIQVTVGEMGRCVSNVTRSIIPRRLSDALSQRIILEWDVITSYGSGLARSTVAANPKLFGEGTRGYRDVARRAAASYAGTQDHTHG